MPIETAKRSYYQCNKCNSKTEIKNIYGNAKEAGTPYGLCPQCSTCYLSPVGMSVYNAQYDARVPVLGFEEACKEYLKEDN